MSVPRRDVGDQPQSLFQARHVDRHRVAEKIRRLRLSPCITLALLGIGAISPDSRVCRINGEGVDLLRQRRRWKRLAVEQRRVPQSESIGWQQHITEARHVRNGLKHAFDAIFE